jgi:hypothetical protein
MRETLRVIRSGRLSLPPDGRRGADEYPDQQPTDPDYLLSLRSPTSLFVIAGLVPATHGTSKVRLSPVMTGRTSIDSPPARKRGEKGAKRAPGRGASVRKMGESYAIRDNSDMCLAPFPGSQVNEDSAQAWTNLPRRSPTPPFVIAGLVPATHGAPRFESGSSTRGTASV